MMMNLGFGDAQFRTLNGSTAWNPVSREYVWEVELDDPFVQVVPSWSADTPEDSALDISFEVNDETYRLGVWSLTESLGIRTSFPEHKGKSGYVSTDTFVAYQPQTKLKVRVRAVPGLAGVMPTLDQFYLSFVGREVGATHYSGPNLGPLPVPMRAQMNYPNGNVLCSPTSMSMLIWYWAQQLKKPKIDRDVPAIVASIFDPEWNGTGNWSFNTSYAARVPGLTAYVTRLEGTADLAAWVNAGVPVACSVRYGLLKGNAEPSENDGHIVVVTGFRDGVMTFNDPGRNVVKMEYKQADFERAWARSYNTVYLVYPDRWLIPKRPGAPWDLKSE